MRAFDLLVVQISNKVNRFKLDVMTRLEVEVLDVAQEKLYLSVIER